MADTLRGDIPIPSDEFLTLLDVLYERSAGIELPMPIPQFSPDQVTKVMRELDEHSVADAAESAKAGFAIRTTPLLSTTEALSVDILPDGRFLLNYGDELLGDEAHSPYLLLDPHTGSVTVIATEVAHELGISDERWVMYQGTTESFIDLPE